MPKKLNKEEKLHNDARIIVLKSPLTWKMKKNLPWFLRYKVCQWSELIIIVAVSTCLQLL